MKGEGMFLTLATCMAVPWGAWTTVQKTPTRLLGGPQWWLGLTDCGSLCDELSHRDAVAMQGVRSDGLQGKRKRACHLMVSVVPRDGHLTCGGFCAEGSFFVQKR